MSEDDFGEAIREAREHRGWSQEFLAAKVGATQSTIDRIESGITRRSRVLPEIAAVLDLNLPGFEKKDVSASPVGGFVKVSFVLPQQLVDEIENYKSAVGVASSDEIVRRILDEHIRKRDEFTTIIDNLFAKYRTMRSMRDAAGLVLANHPLVTTMKFQEGGVSFELEEGIKVEATQHGTIYVKKPDGKFYKWHTTSAPTWATSLNRTDDWAEADDDIPF
jgi:transcriptional regulator with XRE-family HTH domain